MRSLADQKVNTVKPRLSGVIEGRRTIDRERLQHREKTQRFDTRHFHALIKIKPFLHLKRRKNSKQKMFDQHIKSNHNRQNQFALSLDKVISGTEESGRGIVGSRCYNGLIFFVVTHLCDTRIHMHTNTNMVFCSAFAESRLASPLTSFIKLTSTKKILNHKLRVFFSSNIYYVKTDNKD